ncbi:MAG: AAA family ATPase [Candidatus Hydrogenedentes bacterium]|nr:AAA family ATPase [Candidatus Hydrogenedentota bacterium]
MQIESLRIKNYRLFRDASFDDLEKLAIVVGANGTGKSTLFDVFAFLQEALNRNVAEAISKRGGLRELVSRGCAGPIEFTIKFRETAGCQTIYQLAISDEHGQAAIVRERVYLCSRANEKTWHLLDFAMGKGTAITNEQEFSESHSVEETMQFALKDLSALAIKGLGQFMGFRIVSELRSLIENWHVSDIRIDDFGPSHEASHAEHLSVRGDNLAQVARHLYEHHPDLFNEVLTRMRERIPGVNRVEPRTTEDGRLVLRFQDGSFKDPFSSRYVSDGTLKLFAYLVLLYDPAPHPMLAVEEPENQLYPELLYELLEEFRDYARRGGQVFVSTHSPDFLNGAKLDEIYWLVKENGFTTVRRASDSELLRNLIQEGDIPGTLWKQGLFEGAGLR